MSQNPANYWDELRTLPFSENLPTVEASQRPITDVGYVGLDKGKGGKYLLLPPDYEGEIPEGYYTFTSPTYNVFVFWRAFIKELILPATTAPCLL